MKKINYLFVFLTVLILLFFTGCLGSDNDTQEEDNTADFDLFVGKWQVDVNNSTFLDEGYTTSEEIWTFLSEEESAEKVDPLYYILEVESKDTDGEYHNHSCFWELTKTGVYITTGYDYKYTFSNNNLHLELKTYDEPEYHKYVLDKI